jgi:ferrous iron transport protein B
MRSSPKERGDALPPRIVSSVSSEPTDAGSSSRAEPLRTVAVIGNVAVGKSVLCNQLCTRASRCTLPLPGTAAEVPVGTLRHGVFSRSPDGTRIIDAPGMYSLFSRSEDGMVCRRLLLSGELDAVVYVLDAKSLRRSLVIALQLAEFELPTVFALNMVDMAQARGIEVSIDAIEERLGAKVLPTVALERRGVGEIPALLDEARRPRRPVTFPTPIEDTLGLLCRLLADATIPARALAILLLTEAPEARQYVEEHFGKGMVDQVARLVSSLRRDFNRPLDVVLTESYAAIADRFAHQSQRVHQRSPLFMTRLGLWAQQLSTGIPLAFAILFLMYLFVGSFGAIYLVDLLNNEIFAGILTPLFKEIVEPIPSAFVRSALVGEDFGVLTTGLFLAFGIVMPVMFCFYLFFGVLEESGYLPRFSVLLHRLMKRIGLSGRGVIPLVMGFSCVTMALLTTRMLDSGKQRLIASLLLTLALPCAPLLAVMLIILARMPWHASVFVFSFVFVQIIVVGALADRLIPGGHAELMLELPPMRTPGPRSVLVTTWRRTWAFMKEAVPLFLLAAFLVFVIAYLGGLRLLEDATRPLMNGLLGLPESAVRVFMKTIVRREAGAVELDLLRADFSNLQLVVSLLTMTLLIPCVNTMVVLFKERGARVAGVILVSSFVYALLAGGLVNHVCRALGITFG